MTVRRALAVAVCLLTLTACDANRFVGGWIPHWSGANGQAAVGNADVAKLFGEVSLFWYGTTTSGGITNIGSASGLSQAVATVRQQGIPVIPTIADTAPAPSMKNVLADPLTRAAHEQAIVDLVVNNNYDGIDLDYEVFAFSHPRADWPSITPSWVAFIRELSGLLHARGKILSVTVPPVWTSDGTASGAVQGYTVYAQEQIIGYVDRLRFMVYDWSVGSPGPIGPISWVNNVIAHSNRVLPAPARSKLQLGVPAYGRNWSTPKNAGERCPDGAVKKSSVQMKNAPGLAATVGVAPARHSSGELTFGWTEVVTGPATKPIDPPPYGPPAPVTISSIAQGADPDPLQPALRLSPPGAIVSCTIQHTVYYPDEVSLRQRAEAALSAGWSGIVIWALGYEVPEIYQQLAGIGPVRPGGGPTGALDAPTAPAAGTLRVTGYALHPEFDLPVGVRLTLSGPSSAGSITVTATVERGGMPAGLGAFHGFDETYTGLAPGAYQVCAAMVLWAGAAGPSLGCQAVAVG
jgi:spore germination protein YaaH